MEAEKRLPVIADLYNDVDMVVKNNALNILLNQPPQVGWIKEHPTVKKEIVAADGTKVKVPAAYLPIERIEFLLTSIYTKWRVEVKSTELIANSVVVSVRLHILDPITGEWDWQDGIGASPLQTDAGAGATEFNKIKSGAVMMAAPAAESYAIKDAAEKLGKLFGKDLNRKDEIGYMALEKKFAARELQLEEKLS